MLNFFLYFPSLSAILRKSPQFTVQFEKCEPSLSFLRCDHHHHLHPQPLSTFLDRAARSSVTPLQNSGLLNIKKRKENFFYFNAGRKVPDNLEFNLVFLFSSCTISVVQAVPKQSVQIRSLVWKIGYLIISVGLPTTPSRLSVTP